MSDKFMTNFVGGTSRSVWARLGCGYTQNMYLETKDSTEHYYSRVLLPFPGHEHIADVSGSARGMFTAVGGYGGESVYFVQGNTLYCIYDGTALAVGRVGDGAIDFAEIRTADKNFLLVSDCSSLFAIDMTESPALQQMVSVPLPRRVKSDGTYGSNIQPTSVCVCYSMVNVVDYGTDRFYTSVTLPFKLSDGIVDYDAFAVSEAPQDYDGGERPYYQVGYYTYAEAAADPIQKLVTDGTSLYAIGKSSYDRFTYTGVAISKTLTAGVVWKAPRGDCGFYGTDYPESVCVMGGSVYYVSRNPKGGSSVVRLNSSFELVSTPEIDSMLGVVGSSMGFQWAQHPFYVLRMDSVALAYDIREGVWSTLVTNGQTWEVAHCTTSGSDILIQYQGGYGRFSASKWTDHSGNAIVRKRRGVVTNSNDDEFQLDHVRVVTNAGQYSAAGRDFVCAFSWTEDGMTWNGTGNEVLGAVGQYDRVLDVYDLGVGRNFGIEISCSEDIPFCIYGIAIDAQKCDY